MLDYFFKHNTQQNITPGCETNTTKALHCVCVCQYFHHCLHIVPPLSRTVAFTFCVWTNWTLKWAWWISISCVGSINLLETTYLDPGIVSSEISFCAAIHCGYTCYFFISSHLQPLKLFKCFFEECLIKFKKTRNKTPSTLKAIQMLFWRVPD